MNNNDFYISPRSVHGLGSDLVAGSCSIDKDLALINESGRWKLIDSRKEQIPLGETVIRGAALMNVMKAVAKREKLPPPPLTDKEFQILSKNSKFRYLCRLIPGIGKKRSMDALHRAYDSAKIVGKGLVKIEKKNLPGQIVGFAGRYVGEAQGIHAYWIRELVFRDNPKTSQEIEILATAWRQDKTTPLSLKEWYAAKQEEWAKLKPGKEFLPWIAALSWLSKQKEAYHKENPENTVNEQEFQAWVEAQLDPVLFLPKWLLKEFSGKDNEADFQVWRNELISNRHKEWETAKKETGLVNLTYEDFEKFSAQYDISGSIENFERWIIRQHWEKDKSKGITSDDFTTYALKLKWNHETGTGKTSAAFDDWKREQEQAVHERHINTHIPLPFDVWRAQQDFGILVEPAPFILLNEHERKVYQTTCENGRLKRNGFPFNTEFEKTLHSGNGYAILVIGPDDDLYCGSHIGGVFHHSSFLGEGAIIAAGEIKTNPDGTIAELSSKSGHYRPTDIQNLYLLRYFQNRGLDLSNIKFKFYNANGKTEERNALRHLQELEHIQALNNASFG